MARNRLEAEGIRAFVDDANTVGWLWHLGTALKGIKVLVPEADVPRAVEILEGGAELPEEELGEEWWECSKCGTRIDGGFQICWSCGTSIDGIENPNFRPDDAPPVTRPADRVRRKRAPGPLTALIVGFCIPAALLNATVGIGVFVAGGFFPVSASLLLLLAAAEMLLVVGLFQSWYYRPPSEPVEPADGAADATVEEMPAPDDAAIAVIARRACLAAIFGMAFLPPLLNFYSIWLIMKYELYRDDVGRQYRGLISLAILINVVVCVVALLLLLLAGGLRGR